MHNRNHSHERVGETGWSSFITGALIGGGVALLLAPQSGTELRSMLSNYASRAKDDLLERAEKAYDEGKEVIRDAEQSAREFAHQGEEGVKKSGRAAKEEFAQQTQDMSRDPRRSAL